MTHKKADIKAPRFRTTKWRYSFINKKLYKEFINDHPRYEISYDDFLLINKYINKEIISLTIENREGVMLPKNMGHIWLGLFPPTRKTLVETGQTKFDFHSSGLQGKIVYDFKNVRYNIENTEFYGFIAHRTFKRTVSKAFLNHAERYMRIDHIIRKHEAYKIKKLEENERNLLDNTLSNQSD